MLLYRTLKVIVPPIIRLYHRVKVVGYDNFDHNRHYIVVGNHVSQLDPIYIGAFYPNPLHFMAKKELFDIKFLNWIMTKLGAFPVNREAADLGAIKKALRYLNNQESMGLFPEGGRTEKWDETALKQGAAFLALRTKVPVLPVAVFGTKQAKPKGKYFVRPYKVRIMYGKPIPVTEDTTIDEYSELIKKALTDLIEEGTKRGWRIY